MVAPEDSEFMDEYIEMIYLPAAPNDPWTKQYNLYGKDVGSCKFIAVYAQYWEFDWDTSPEEYSDKLEFTVKTLHHPTV